MHKNANKPGNGAEFNGSGAELDARIEDELRALPLPDYAADPPNRHVALAGACRRAPRPARPWYANRFVLADAIVLVVIAAAAVWFWPHADQPDGNGVALGPQSAWAKTDGYIIDVDFIQWSLDIENMKEEDIQALPGNQLHTVVDSINTPGNPEVLVRNELPFSSTCIRDGIIISSISLMLKTQNEELLDQVVTALREIAGLSAPVVYKESLYLNGKYPQLYTPERKLIINGREYHYPTEIDAEYVETVHNIFRFIDRDWVVYKTYFTSLQKRGIEPLVPGDVIEIRFNAEGDLVLNTVVEHWDPGVDSRERKSVALTNVDLAAGIDPLELLRESYLEDSGSASADEETLKHYHRAYIVFWFIPRDRLLAAYDELLTTEELAQSRADYDRLQAVVETWRSQHPQRSRTDPDYTWLRTRPPATFGIGVAWTEFTLKARRENDIDEFVQLVTDSTGIEPEVEKSWR
ncbi:hypothetical protein JW859_03165 [bacterium]|nr:hypothetical protein [bacterium]